MSTLRSTIEDLAAEFAANVIGALRHASLHDISAITQANGAPKRGRGRPAGSGASAAPAAPAARARRGKGGRLARRSVEEIGGMVDAIGELLTKHPEGLRAEQIRDRLGCDTKELPRPLMEGLSTGRFTKQGQKRATTYFVGAGGAGRRRGRPAKKK
jgi:hypothetical protein